jgi:hypothetical protein
MSQKLHASPFVFRFALWRAAGKAYRQGKIQREDRQLMRGVVRRPIRESAMGEEINLCEMLQGAVEGKMLQDVGHDLAMLRFDFFTLMEILLQMLPALLEWIKELIDRLDDDDDPPLGEEAEESAGPRAATEL